MVGSGLGVLSAGASCMDHAIAHLCHRLWPRGRLGVRSALLPVVCLAASLGLAGCPVPQPQNTPRAQWKEIDPATGRGFYIYVPSSYRPDTPAPLIVTCHGTPPYDVAEHHIREWKMLGEENGCIVVAPDLVATDGIFGDGPLVGMLSDEKYILSLVSLLGYRYNIDRANVMITGFSGGGFPTFWVGLRHPDVFSVIVSRNGNFSRGNTEGWFDPKCVQENEVDIMVYYGENDPGTIQSQCESAVSFLTEEGFEVRKAVIPRTGHERRPEVAMKFFREHWRQAKPSLPIRASTRVADAE